MFWKKIFSPAPILFNKQYVCLAPDYSKEVYSDQGEFYDAAKEKLFACLRNRQLTSKEIDELNTKFNFDVWKGMIWMNVTDHKKYAGSRVESARYRLKDFSPQLAHDNIKRVMEYFNFELFYNSNDIAVVSGIIGLDLMSECIWDKYTKNELNVPGQESCVYYTRKNNIQEVIINSY